MRHHKHRWARLDTDRGWERRILTDRFGPQIVIWRAWRWVEGRRVELTVSIPARHSRTDAARHVRALRNDLRFRTSDHA